jgi:hypothetical protein
MTDISFTVNSQVFTFAEGECEKITSTISSDCTSEKLPGAGPMNNYLNDYDGSDKTISITGCLFETVSSRVTGHSINTIIEQKQWLESLINGMQRAVTFTSNYESLTILSSSSATPPYQGSFTYTKGYIKNITFTEYMGQVNKLDFSISIIIGAGI